MKRKEIEFLKICNHPAVSRESHCGTGLYYCEEMRSITVSVDDDTYERARVAAAGRDTSASALVKAFLEQLGSEGPETERLKRQEREIRSRILGFGATLRLSRDDVHHRSDVNVR